MKFPGPPKRLEVILETRPLLDLVAPLEPLLARVQLSAKDIGEYVFSTWTSFDSAYMYYYNDEPALTILRNNAYHDLLFSARLARLSPSEQQAVHDVVVNLLTMYYMLGHHFFDRLNLDDHQLMTLRPLRWYGKSLAVELII